MEKKKKKTPVDINQLAKFIVDQTTMDVQTKNTHPSEIPMKNPAAGFPPAGVHLATSCWASFDIYSLRDQLIRK